MPGRQVLVFDACAVIALLEAEPGVEVVEQLLDDPSNRCLLSPVNACEVYYDFLRRGYGEATGILEPILAGYELQILETLTPEIWQTAGTLKAQWRRVSLADCFGLALAIQEKGTFVTSDHKELDALALAGVCPIRFIR